MRARARLVNFGLLGLSLLSLGLVIWTEREPTTLERQVRERHVLEVFRREDVQRIELRQGDRRTVVERRTRPPSAALLEEAEPGLAEAEAAEGDAAEWTLTEPFETDADQATVDELLGGLQYATWEREISAEKAPDALVSQRELTLGMQGHSYTLRLGGDAVSPQGARYVEVVRDGGAPHTLVLKKRLVEDLFIDGEAFRGRQIVPYRKGSIDRLVLSSAAGVRRLKRAGGDFHFDGMQEDQRVDRHAIDRVFMALARASAEPFVNVDAAEAALATDAGVRVSITPASRDKPEASLSFGGKCPTAPDQKTVAIRHAPEPLAGCVDKSVLYALREPASALIDRRLFGLDADEVDTVRIVEGESVLEFARGGDGFVLQQPRSAPLDTDAAKDRLARIVDIQGELLMGASKPKDGASYSGITLALETSARPGEERTLETVRISAALADGGRRVYREADGAVLAISPQSALSLHADATLLKEHKVFDYPLDRVRRIEVVNGSVKQTLERSAEGVLRLVSPAEFDVDGGLATELIDEVRALRALRWVTDREGPGFGLDKPRATLKLSVEVDGQTIERTLALGSRAPGGYYARVDRDPGVFVAPRALERTLGTWLFDRAVFSAEGESIVELVVEAEGRGKVVLQRVAGQLTLQNGTTDFDPDRVDELLDALATLRSEAAVHLGPATPGEGLRKPILTVMVRRQSIENVGMPPLRFSVGSRDSFNDASIYYARLNSVNATYALPREQVQRLLDLF